MWDPESAAEYMKKLSEKSDKEFRHIEMDNFLCTLLRQMGYKDVVEIFKSTPKWCA